MYDACVHVSTPCINFFPFTETSQYAYENDCYSLLILNNSVNTSLCQILWHFHYKINFNVLS